jgi:hypothetical protein
LYNTVTQHLFINTNLNNLLISNYKSDNKFLFNE